MFTGTLNLSFFAIDFSVALSILSVALTVFALWEVGILRRRGISRSKIRRQAQERGVEPLGVSLLEAVSEHAACEAELLLTSESDFDESAARHLESLLESGVDPRETVKDLALLKKELKLPVSGSVPALLSRVIVSDTSGGGACEGRIVRASTEFYRVVLGKSFQGLRRGAIVELVFADGDKMAGLAAVVQAVEEKGPFTSVRLAAPERGGFRKREHFRIDTNIQATLLVRSDQVAYMPDDKTQGESREFRVVSAELVNLSGGGGRLKLRFPVQVGDKLCLSFALSKSGKPLGSEGRVVWAKKEEEGVWVAGFEFEGMDPENFRRLILYLFARQSERVVKSTQK